ncbi:MAG TPA: diguanylate cyclase [Allosphingosinicella sp.]|nr:diguanylate cyclase [Allosphingosinicella sp.]
MIKLRRKDDSAANRLTCWLLGPPGDLPADARLALTRSLFRVTPPFLLGTINTLVVSIVMAVHFASLPFIGWAVLEVLVAATRVPVLISARRAGHAGHERALVSHTLLALGSAASVGIGSFLCITSGDWIAATLACLASAAMVGGCLRNFAAPRLVAARIFLILLPSALALLFLGQSILLIVALQVPLFAGTMIMVAFQLNRMAMRTAFAESENDRRARHDPLTGLVNRAGLAQIVAEWTGRNESFALHYLDLDGFKGINDNFSHEVGDELLKSVGERLRSVCRPEDVIARIGGDEFVVLSTGSDEAAARIVAERLVAAIGEKGFLIGNEAAFVGVSIGISLFPDHGMDLGALLGEADAALYQAKFWGRSRCVVARSAQGRAYAGGLTSSLPAVTRLLIERDAA